MSTYQALKLIIESDKKDKSEVLTIVDTFEQSGRLTEDEVSKLKIILD